MEKKYGELSKMQFMLHSIKWFSTKYGKGFISNEGKECCVVCDLAFFLF